MRRRLAIVVALLGFATLVLQQDAIGRNVVAAPQNPEYVAPATPYLPIQNLQPLW